MKKSRYLGCSRGCKHDTDQMWYQHLKAGDRCPDVLSYDRMTGTTNCRRILYPVDEAGKKL